MPRFINNLSHIQSRWHQADSEIGAGQEMRREKHLALPILQIVFCVCFCRVFLVKTQKISGINYFLGLLMLQLLEKIAAGLA